jgi:hypothetical protein
VDVGEGAAEDPVVFGVVDFEAAVGRDTGVGWLVRFEVGWGGERYKSGWIGLRSVPRTSAEGYFWAVELLMDTRVIELSPEL